MNQARSRSGARVQEINVQRIEYSLRVCFLNLFVLLLSCKNT